MTLLLKVFYLVLVIQDIQKYIEATNQEILRFTCINGMEITLINVCDGLPHCNDSSDETAKLCQHIVCPLTAFKCAYGACIPRSGRCNGFVNCIDGSDEFFCDDESNCTSQMFRCLSSLECISLSMICDGFTDCADQSDENIEICKDYICPIDTFQCSYGGCVYQEVVCDGFKDCIDGIDEAKDVCAAANCNDENCQTYACKNNEFSCDSNSQCIPLNKLCDGTHQCRDASDEKSDVCKNISCSEDYFRCAYGGCIPLSSRCNHRADCYDWSDEEENMCGNLLPQGACRLPPTTPGTWYNVENCERCHPGNVVSEFTKLEYSCYGNKSIEGASFVYCQDGRWLPSLPICLNASNVTKCPVVNSSGTLKYCKVKSGSQSAWTSCDKPALIGTRVSMECRQFYEKERGSSHVICLHDGTWNQTPLTCRPICGIKSSSLTTMIVRGWNISPEEYFPWHATLFSQDNGLWNFFCGGTLIAESIVLTAGHCIWKTKPDTIKVLLASNSSNFTNQNEETQVRDVDRIILHNSYQDYEGNYGSDLALLIFKNPATINSNVVPACIDWSNKFDITQRIGEVGFVVGMGVTENDTFSSNLRVVTAQIISENICREKESRDFRKYLTYTSFCAGWANGTSVCNGDSGGGFLLSRPNSNIWEVHGIVSLSPRRLGTYICDPNYYTIFTKILPYANWIKNIVQSVLVSEIQFPNNYSISINDNIK